MVCEINRKSTGSFAQCVCSTFKVVNLHTYTKWKALALGLFLSWMKERALWARRGCVILKTKRGYFRRRSTAWVFAVFAQNPISKVDELYMCGHSSEVHRWIWKFLPFFHLWDLPEHVWSGLVDGRIFAILTHYSWRHSDLQYLSSGLPNWKYFQILLSR